MAKPRFTCGGLRLGYTSGIGRHGDDRGRWREPGPRSSPYITAEGERALRDELRDLGLRRRQDVVPARTAAPPEGDRTENAEYS